MKKKTVLFMKKNSSPGSINSTSAHAIRCTLNKALSQITSKSTLLLLLLIALLTAGAASDLNAQCTGCTTSVSSSNGTARTVSGSQKLCFTGGTYTGAISSMAGTVCVSSAATFKPSTFSNFTGAVYIYGTATIPGSTISASTRVYNYGNLTISGTVGFSGAAEITNYEGGTLTFSNALALSNNAKLENYGTLILNSLTLNSGCTFNNYNITRISGTFSTGGTVVNGGFIRSLGAVSVSSGSFTNNCRLFGGNGFTGSGTITQNGFMYIAAGSIALNSGSFSTGTSSEVRGVDFNNSIAVSGSGRFYFSGTTTNNTTSFGSDGGGINFYDVAVTGGGTKKFDNQNNPPHSSVVRTAFTPGDTTGTPPGTCSSPYYTCTPVVADAGADQTRCNGSTSFTMAANAPVGATGTWSVVSGTASIGTASSATTTVTVAAGNTAVLRWTLVNGCSNTTSDVTISHSASPTTANAGTAQTRCNGSTSFTMAANTATTGTGAWSLVSGNGTITNTASPTTTVTVPVGSTATLRWSITNGVCAASTNDITITHNAAPTTATAGPDQIVCSTGTSFTLAANTPASGTGTWSVVSGTATIGTASSPTTTVTVAAGNTATLRWTISAASCTSSTDDVVINNKTKPNAGSALAICGTATTASLGAAGTGNTWTALATNPAPVTLNATTGAVSAISTAGTYNFVLTNSNGCADTVALTKVGALAAGDDEIVSASTVALGAAPSGFTWSALSGNPSSASIGSSNGNVTGMANTGVYSFMLTHSAAGCKDTVMVYKNPAEYSLTKGASLVTGGMANTGDTIQYNITLTLGDDISLNNYSVYDTVPTGLSYIAGSMKIDASSVTDLTTDSDPGGIAGGVARWNLGSGASKNAGGTVSGKTTIVVSYKAKITAASGTIISNTGHADYKIASSSSAQLLTTHTNTVNNIILPTVGLCNGPVGTNLFTKANGGTFGSGTAVNGAPLGSGTSYTYAAISSSMPDDGYYVVANTTDYNGSSTSGGNIFGTWDMIGDHTGASNTTNGNATPTTGANAGYMMIVNASYNPGVAITDTITSLCPNTNYTYSAWIRSMCDCSVKPKLAFTIDGVDYYSTGDIAYASKWVNVGFTFATKPGQTSVILSIKNVAPGGEGNDWALDDVSLTYCAPVSNISLSPASRVCAGSNITVSSNITSSGSEQYEWYMFQQSSNGGTSWTNLTGVKHQLTSQTNYTAAHGPMATTAAMSGYKYRVLISVDSTALANQSTCLPTVNAATLTVDAAATAANAGTDITQCNTSAFTLAGNAPTVGTGAWSLLSGSATIANTALRTSGATVAAGNTASLLWTITNATCSSKDTVVLLNNALPTTANAGTNIIQCNNSTFNLSANSPTIGTGAWSVLSGPATIANTALNTSTATLAAGSTASLVWTITNGNCTPSKDTVVITNSALPTTSDAGADQSKCNTAAFTMAANAPTVGTGVWSLTSGTATIATASLRTTGVTVAAGNTATLTWTITNGVCTSTDAVVLANYATPTTANAGADITQCNNSAFTLAANAPTTGTGAWSVAAGNGTIANAALRNSAATLAPGGSSMLVWSVTNGVCTVSKDTVIITNHALPSTANAGADITQCNTAAFTLNGNTPSSGTATWSVLSGSATIANASSSNSGATLAAGATSSLLYTITNGNCAASKDTVILTNVASPSTANAGTNITQCNNAAFVLAATAPTVGTGAWSVAGGSATIANPSLRTSAATLSAGNTATLIWSVSNGMCPVSRDTIIITNNALPTAANAGTNITQCNNSTFTLAANNPATGTGAWSVLSGSAAIANTAANSTTATLAAGGTSSLVWTITNGNCAASKDTLTITNSALPTTADAGSDQSKCNTASFTMAANAPATGTGAWAIISGTATITNAALRTTAVSVAAGNTVSLAWTITNGICSSADTVVLSNVAAPTTANAGTDITQCNNSSFTLAATAPTTGTGTWTVASGNGTIANTASRTSSVTLASGSTALVWSVTNGMCAISRDTVILTNNLLPTASNAGPDITQCNTAAFTMAANVPTVGAGVWSVVSGTATIATASSATSGVTVASGVTARLVYTVTNGTCATSKDTVVLTNSASATASNAGPDQSKCNTSAFTLAANAPTVGTGAWSVVSGTATIATATLRTSGATVATGVTASLVWTITNGACTSRDTVILANGATPTTANAGPAQTKSNSAVPFVMAANTPTTGTGAWSIISGTPVIANTASPATDVTVSIGDSAVLRWTISNGSCSSTSNVTIKNNITGCFCTGNGEWSTTATWAGNCHGGGNKYPNQLDTAIIWGKTVTVGIAPVLLVTAGSTSTAICKSLNIRNNGATASSLTLNLASQLTILNNVEMRATVQGGAVIDLASTSKLLLGGNINRNASPVRYGKITSASGTTITFNGTVAQVIPTSRGNGSDGIQYQNVIFNNTSNLSPAFTSEGRVDIANTIGLIKGCINMEGDTLMLTNSSNTSVTGGSDSSYVMGQFCRYIGQAGKTYRWSVGREGIDKMYWFELKNNLLIGTSYVCVEFDSMPEPDKEGIQVVDQDLTMQTIAPEGLWRVEPNAQPIAGNYDVRVQTQGFSDLTDDNFALIKRPTGSDNTSWGKHGGLIPSLLGGVLNLGRKLVDGFTTLNGLTSFSEFGIGNSNGGALPVKLISFEAKAVDNKYIQLDWATSVEIDNKGFEVQRSEDAKEFTRIGWVDGHGTTTEMQNYAYEDNTVLANIKYYYRLRQQDFDGKEDYSMVRYASIKGEGSLEISDFVPNPASQNTAVNIKSDSDMEAYLEFVNMMGQVVKRGTIQINKGTHLRMFEVNELANGTYMVVITTNGGKYTKRLMVQQ
jgi:hypothetical protein